METDAIKRILEAALLAAGRPLSLNDLEQLFTGDVDAPPRDAIRGALAELADDWQARSLALQEVASGYRAQVREEFEPWLARMWDEKPARYSRALLETLAIIAYRQPITRSEIEDIRGVSVSTQIMRTLTEREWVRVVGHREAPGKPAMYGTTRQFLDHFNLKTLDQLPELSELSEVSAQHPELGFEQQPEASAATGAHESEAAADEGGSGERERIEDEAAEAVTADEEATVAEETSGEETSGFEVSVARSEDGETPVESEVAAERTDSASASEEIAPRGEDREGDDADTDRGPDDEDDSAAADAEDGSCTHVS